MRLRREIEPDLKIAEKRYAKIKEKIAAYTDYCDENSDERLTEYKKLAHTLQALVKKDLSAYNLWEWWEEEGLEVLSFRIALPAPKRVADITKKELTEIVRRLDNPAYLPEKAALSFSEIFSPYLGDYYHDFLKLNFTTYHYPTIFGPRKDKNKQNYWLSIEEKVAILWDSRGNNRRTL